MITNICDKRVPNFDCPGPSHSEFWLSRPILSLGKISSLSCCPFVLGQLGNFCPFVPKSCNVPSPWKPYFEVLSIHCIIWGVPTSKYGWIGNGSMFTVDWIVCSLQSAADKKGPSRQKRAQRLCLKVIFFWKLSLNIWSHHKPEKSAGFNSIQYSMMKNFHVFGH